MMIYCECETPVTDIEFDSGCRRCGRPIDWSPIPAGAWPMQVDDPMDNCLGCAEGKLSPRQHALDCPRRFELEHERGSVDPQLVVVGVGLFALFGIAFLVWLLWPYLVGAGILYAAFRHLTRHTRRRRPRSSWSSLGRTAALLYAAWNSRWLKPSDRRVTVPTRADYGGRWDQ